MLPRNFGAARGTGVDADFTAVVSLAPVAAAPPDPVPAAPLAGWPDPVPVGPVLQPATARQARSSSGGRHRCSGGRLGFIGCCLVPVVLPLERGPAAYGEAVPSRLKEPTCA